MLFHLYVAFSLFKTLISAYNIAYGISDLFLVTLFKLTSVVTFVLNWIAVVWNECCLKYEQRISGKKMHSLITLWLALWLLL